MSDLDLYQLSQRNTVDVNQKPQLWTKLKSGTLNWLTKLTSSPDIEWLIDYKHLTEEEEVALMSYVLKCTAELLDAVVESCGGLVNIYVLQAIGSACFIISLKLILGNDLLDTFGIYRFLRYMSNNAQMTEYLPEYEADILARTDWKGCPTAFLTREDNYLGSRRHSGSSGCSAYSGSRRRSGSSSRRRSSHSSRKRHSGSRCSSSRTYSGASRKARW